MTIPSLMKMAESYPKTLKTLSEKEKLLVTSNFSFPHSVFTKKKKKQLVLQTCEKRDLFGKGLTVKGLKIEFISGTIYRICGGRSIS